MQNRSTFNSTVKEALQATPECLTPQQLEACVTDPAGHPHLAQCSRCQAELSLLKSFEANELLADEGAAVAWISARMEKQLDQIKNPRSARAASAATQGLSWFSRIFGAGPGRWLVPVAAALVIAVTTVALLHRSQEPELRADAGTGPAIYRSQELEVKGPSGELAEAPKTLEWKAFTGAAEYKVSIMEVDEVPLFSSQTRDLILTIPGATRAKMLPGKPVLWRVTALDSQGRTLAASQVQHFSVRRKSSSSNSGVLPR
jgi:hypothetical protein